MKHNSADAVGRGTAVGSLQAPNPLKLLAAGEADLTEAVRDGLTPLMGQLRLALQTTTAANLPNCLRRAGRHHLLATAASSWLALPEKGRREWAGRVCLLAVIQDGATAVTSSGTAVLNLPPENGPALLTQFVHLLVKGQTVTGAAAQLNLAERLNLPDNEAAIWPGAPAAGDPRGAAGDSRVAPAKSAGQRPVEQRINWAAGSQVNIDRRPSSAADDPTIRQEIAISGEDQINIRSGGLPPIQLAANDGQWTAALDRACPHCRYNDNSVVANHCENCGRPLPS